MAFIEVSGGEFATFEESERACQTWQLQHPVLWDAKNRNHRNYGITSWTSAYLIDPDGNVFWQGNPERLFARPEELQRFRLLLEKQLKKAGTVENANPPVKSNLPTKADDARSAEP